MEDDDRVYAYSPRPNARLYDGSIVKPGSGPPFTLDTIPFDTVMHGDAKKTLERLPDRCVDLVILDPPYWKVVGEKWDYRWRTEEDYRRWCYRWLEEVERVCKRSSSLYIFGYVRNLVYLFHDIVDFGFEFRHEITIDKGIKSVAGRKTSTYKQFPNTTETIFFFVYNAKKDIRELLTKRQEELGLSTKEINERLGVRSNGGGMWSLYAGENIMGQVPTPEMWERLEKVLDFKAPEDLKGFTFNPQMGLTNVWNDIDFYDRNRIHRTQKPVKLIERLVLASSNAGQVVLDPFAGSGTVAVVSKALGRKCISMEIDQEMVDKANKRLCGE